MKMPAFFLAVMPVAVAIMTPILPIALLIMQKLTGKGGAPIKEEKKDPLFNIVEDSSIHSNNSSFTTGGYQPAPLAP